MLILYTEILLYKIRIFEDQAYIDKRKTKTITCYFRTEDLKFNHIGSITEEIVQNRLFYSI